MCRAKVIIGKKIGFKKKVRVVSASRFFLTKFFLKPNFFLLTALCMLQRSQRVCLQKLGGLGLGVVVVSAVTVQLNEKKVAVVLTKR
jgi:hypothetical protein